MWQYEKKLQYPVKIKTPNPTTAKIIITQFGGPDGELGAATRYLSQRYTAPCSEVKAILNDIGTEELGHIEMIGAIVYQLTKNLTPNQIKEALTGYGKATKTQMQFMVTRLLGLKSIPKPDDAADALAVALTQAQTGRLAGMFRV